MRALRKFFTRSLQDQGLLLHAFGLVGTVRLGLKVLPYRTVRRLVEVPFEDKAAHAPLSEQGRAEQKRIVAAVESVGRRLLGDKPCLTQALVTQRLLRQAGYDSELHIGVTKEEGEFLAHAWLQQDGIIVTGGTASPVRYTPLVEVGPPAP